MEKNHEDELYELLKTGQNASGTTLETNDASTKGDSDIYEEPATEPTPEPDEHSAVAEKEHRKVRGGVLSQAFNNAAKKDPQDREVKVSHQRCSVNETLREQLKQVGF